MQLITNCVYKSRCSLVWSAHFRSCPPSVSVAGGIDVVLVDITLVTADDSALDTVAVDVAMSFRRGSIYLAVVDFGGLLVETYVSGKSYTTD